MLLGKKLEIIKWERHAERMDKLVNLYRDALVRPERKRSFAQHADKCRILLNGCA